MSAKPYTLYRGDSLEVLRTLADNSIDAIVTDPPYGLSSEPDMNEVLRHWLAGDDYHHKGAGFMGKSWDSFVPGPAVWREALRVLKPGGYLLAFFGTRTQDIGTLAIRLAGFEIRDCIDRWHDGGEDVEQFMNSLDPVQRDAFLRLQDRGDARMSWTYGSGFPKSLDVSKAIDKAAGAMREVLGERAGGMSVKAGGVLNYNGRDVENGVGMDSLVPITAPATDAARQWAGFGTALKPAHEPICIARKPLVGTVAANVLAFGTGALNIDGCRVVGPKHTQSTSHPGGMNGTYSPLPARGPQVDDGRGRWPANLIHDGSPEVVALFPDAAGQLAKASTSTTQRSGQNTYGKMARGPNGQEPRNDSGSAARFFYCAKASKTDRDEGLDAFAEQITDVRAGHRSRRMDEIKRPDGAEPARGKNHHPTVKPTDLMAYLVRLVTPPGGVVLDMYMGSGTTGKACMREGFTFIGIDKDADEHGNPLGYVEIAAARIEHELAQVAIAAEQAALDAAQLDLFAETVA